MGLGPGDECDAGHGPVPRKIEALNTGTTCPSRDREKWGKERIPSASPVGNELNQEEYQSCSKTPQYRVASPCVWRWDWAAAELWQWKEQGQVQGQILVR